MIKVMFGIGIGIAGTVYTIYIFRIGVAVGEEIAYVKNSKRVRDKRVKEE